MKNIQIEQKEVSFGKQFQININRKFRYLVDGFPNFLFGNYFIRNPDTHEVLIRIKIRSRLLNARYIIENRPENKKYIFKTKSYFRNSYICQTDSKKYELFEHRELKYSIYRDDYLTAYAKRERYSFLQGDSYNITLDETEDILLIIALFICMDDYRGNNDSLFRINLGVANEAIPYREDI